VKAVASLTSRVRQQIRNGWGSEGDFCWLTSLLWLPLRVLTLLCGWQEGHPAPHGAGAPSFPPFSPSIYFVIFCYFYLPLFLFLIRFTCFLLIRCSWQTHTMHCIMAANVLQTNKVDAECDKLATKLIWQRFTSKVANIQLPHLHLTYPPSAFGASVGGDHVLVLLRYSGSEN